MAGPARCRQGSGLPLVDGQAGIGRDADGGRGLIAGDGGLGHRRATITRRHRHRVSAHRVEGGCIAAAYLSGPRTEAVGLPLGTGCQGDCSHGATQRTIVGQAYLGHGLIAGDSGLGHGRTAVCPVAHRYRVGTRCIHDGLIATLTYHARPCEGIAQSIGTGRQRHAARGAGNQPAAGQAGLGHRVVLVNGDGRDRETARAAVGHRHRVDPGHVDQGLAAFLTHDARTREHVPVPAPREQGHLGLATG